MVRFIAITQTLEDLDGVSDRGLLDEDRLEAAVECGVLLEMLAVLIKRRGTDGLQLTTGQHGLENARCVDRTFGSTGTDESVDLIDEQDDVAASADLFEDLLEAFFEVTAVARAGDECAEVERVDLLVAQGLGDVAADDVLGEALDDCGLADAGLADEHGVVLGAARECLHDALRLVVTTDDRIELALASSLRQVATKLVEDCGRARSALRLAARLLGLLALEAGDELNDLLAHTIEVSAELDQHLRGNALALADQAEQDVLGADVVVSELQGLAEAQLKDLLGAGGERDVTAGSLLALADDVFDLAAYGLQRDVEAFESLGGYALALVDQAEEDVLGADVVVAEHACLFLGKHDHATCTVSESLEHCVPLCWTISSV